MERKRNDARARSSTIRYLDRNANMEKRISPE
jgi:hypothetical protein